MQTTHQLCTFFLADLFVGLDVSQVQEVVRHQTLTRVPLAPGSLRGLLNLRGQIVLTIDLRRCFGLRDDPGDPLPMHVVALAGDEVVSLLVDRIGDILEVNDSSFEGVPETVYGTARELIRGAYKLEDQLLLELDLEKAVAIAEGGSQNGRTPNLAGQEMQVSLPQRNTLRKGNAS